jgi:hypothetical protein
VAHWVYRLSKERKDAEFELVDIAEYNLPLLDEPVSPIFGQYTHEHTMQWAAKIANRHRGPAPGPRQCYAK